MAAKLSSDRLLRVAKAVRETILHWKEGVSLVADSGASIEQLLCRTAAARWRLASLHRRDGNRLMASQPSLYRSAVSRYYYAMYHALRSAVYVAHPGDDFEEHSKLPSRIPQDFPDRDTWQAKLKDARLMRNRADYDPYPRRDAAWRADAATLQSDVRGLMRVTRSYLRMKGCML